MNHRDARILSLEAFRRQYAREPNRSEAQHLQGVAWNETSYGTGWHRPPDWPAGDPFDPENMGAVQKGHDWTGRTFRYTDTHPNQDGTSRPYVMDFRYYADAQKGMDDAARVVYVILDRIHQVLPYATRGDTLGFSTGMYDTHYYEGFGGDEYKDGKLVRTAREVRIGHHRDAMLHAIALQAAALGEPMPDGSEPPHVAPRPPTLRLHAQGEAVKKLQRLLNVQLPTLSPPLDVDGGFGRLTRLAVEAYQKLRGLKVDGVVGWATWAALGAV